MIKKPEMNEDDVRSIIDSFGDMVYKIAFSYCKNRADAEDIYQTVFMKYFQYGRKFESKEHEKAWLLRVTINSSKSFLRSSWHKRIILLENDQEEAVCMEEESTLLSSIMELPVKYREVIHLFYYEGYTTREIAGILKRRETTVRTQLQRGRDMLRVKIKEVFSYE